MRTPRAAIVAWYTDVFAPRALDPFLAHARQRVTQALTDDLNSQMLLPRFAIQGALDAIIEGVIVWFDDVIRERFQPLFGLGISGAISGVLHDQDNERGIWVSSEAHPTPWKAYGDSHLTCSPVSCDQAELAVITAMEQLVEAQALGRTRRT